MADPERVELLTGPWPAFAEAVELIRQAVESAGGTTENGEVMRPQVVPSGPLSVVLGAAMTTLHDMLEQDHRCDESHDGTDIYSAARSIRAAMSLLAEITGGPSLRHSIESIWRADGRELLDKEDADTQETAPASGELPEAFRFLLAELGIPEEDTHGN